MKGTYHRFRSRFWSLHYLNIYTDNDAPFLCSLSAPPSLYLPYRCYICFYIIVSLSLITVTLPKEVLQYILSPFLAILKQSKDVVD
ncbi:hypothetical protein AHF37_06650 [Paragonimus kellicotti]|nr:hypothetical protein AHF37_06650 [Paragonimus kellicotti]